MTQINPVALIPDSAPFTPEQRAWLNGFLAGLFSTSRAGQPETSAKPTAPSLAPLTILFGSQTGTAESLAKRAAKEAGKRGFAATVMDMAAFGCAQLAQEKNILVITSTYGEGEPPDNAKALHAALAASEGLGLAGLRFSVCGLGDTNYVQFCRCGQDFDARLEKLGAARVAPRADCDVDYEEKFTAWLDSALSCLAASPAGDEPAGELAAPAPAAGAIARPASPPPEMTEGFSKQKPFYAPVLAVRRLNGPGSSKEVNHVEFSLADSGLGYEAGDALGIFPQNCPELVDDVLTLLGCDGEEAVPAPDKSIASLRRALTELYDLGKPPRELLDQFAVAAAGPATDSSGAERLPYPHVIDVISAHPSIKLSPVDFVSSLRKLQPRLYSISSSPKAHPGKVHLTVAAVRYEAAGRARKGVCSTFLADRALASATIGVYVHANRSFRPPSLGDAPMIMVGPGTGIAPFRAFLAERLAVGAKGRNWLFFGDQHSATDYLYRDELEAMRASDFLTRLDTAFSRDQPEKIYVQQRMLENAPQFFAWLEDGAHFYVCGDAARMAKDVDAALHRVIEIAGGRTSAQAADYVQALRASKRYARDVY